MGALLIRGATIVDGSGKEPYRGDVAVEGGKITAIAERSTAGGTTLDADGLVLAPGFIDMHSHTDSTLFKFPHMESKAFQGVTLEVTGNCGLGVFPVEERRRGELCAYLRMHDFTLPPSGCTWSDFATYAAAVEEGGIALHQAPLAGHGALRLAALGVENRQSTGSELEEMRRLLDAQLRQGCWGMSTGLIYPPGSFAETEELIALAGRLEAHGALYASHIRNEGEGLFGALSEAIRIGRESGARVQVSHLKALGGGKNRGRAGDALRTIAEARRAGVDIGADQYPYDASATALSALVPQWAHAGGVAGLLERLQAPQLNKRILAEMGKEIAAREGAAGIMVSNCSSAANRPLSGKTLEEIAALWECTPGEAAVRLIVEEEGGVGGIFFSMCEKDVEEILKDPQVAVGSDGHALNAAGAAGEATHPRSYGTFPRILGRYVRQKKVLTLESAVHKMTGLPAQRLGLRDRGLLRPGFAADLVLFDPATVIDRADYTDPHRYSTGVVHLLVAGEAVIENGKVTGKLPGRVLRRM